MYMYSDDDVNQYAASKNLIPGTLLWASDKPLEEEAFRSGGKNNAAVDFLRWQDIGKELEKGRGRIPPEEWGSFTVKPGQGISMFIKRMLPDGMVHLGAIANSKRKDLKEQYDPIIERFWWKIEPGQPLPSGLQLVYDGVPPGHCTLTTDRERTVQEFMGLVGLLSFTSAGSDYYGIKK